MNIVYALDDGYKLYTAVSIYSLLSNKNKESEYRIHILHHPDLDIHYFDKLQQHFNVQFNFVNMENTAECFYESRNIKIPTYYRLFICNVLPDLDRCIYLDGDTIIHKDLSELYDIDLGDNIIGGVYDLPILLDNYKEKEKNRPLIYINAGVLLIDLNNFKKHNAIKRTLEWLNNNPKPMYHDQDAINFSLQGFIKLIPTIYNFHSTKFRCNNLETKIYLFELLKQIDSIYDINKFNSDFNNRVITHYIFKPIGNLKQDDLKCFIDEWYIYFNKYLELLGNKSDDYVICTCAKNEANYIVEWVNYHLKLGFDHIYIHNNDDDQTALKQLLENNIKVSLINYSDKKKFQTEMVKNFYVTGKFKWCAFIDCDEFITINGFNNIKDYINKFPEDCHQICLNWLCYGSNGNKKYNPIPIQKRMPFCGTPIETPDIIKKQLINGHIKSIVKKNFEIKCFFPNCHTLLMTNSYNNCFQKINLTSPYTINQLNYDISFIKHYYTRDLKHFYFNKSNQDAFDDDNNTYILRLTRGKFANTNSLNEKLLQYANIQNNFINNFIDKKILCKNQEKIIPLLKKDLNIVYCGDLKYNNVFINIANYNKCYYNWILPELFNNVYKKTDFDIIIE